MLTEKEEGAHADMNLTSALNKEIMSEIREGDYQHPGEEEAIELVFQRIPKRSGQLLLDIGCGRGGTASYLKHRGWGRVVGIDLNAEIIKVAKEKYEKEGEAFPRFLACDVTTVEACFNKVFSADIKPDVIYLLNSFFLFPDHVVALKALQGVAHKDTKLIVFDYVDNGSYMGNPYKENSKPFLPNCIKGSKIQGVFKEGGWIVSEIENIDEAYIRWYEELMSKIDAHREKYTSKYGEQTFGFFVQRYQHILDALKDGQLSGAVIYAKNNS